jgi:Family of unknown function (DUF6225)
VARLDDFANDITEKARWARDRFNGHPAPAWSTGERLAVALVLDNDAALIAEGYTRQEAAKRISGDLSFYGYTADVGTWLSQIKATLATADDTGASPPGGQRAAWTVGQLRAALAAIPDDTPLVVNAADPSDPNTADEQVIVGAGFGRIDWGDGYGLETDTVFALSCEIPEGELRTRPDRPQRGAGAR